MQTTELEARAWKDVDQLLTGLSPLDRAAAFIEIGDYLTFCGGDAVRTARDAGATWADVGRAFGVTKQAAQQRFGRYEQTWSTD